MRTLSGIQPTGNLHLGNYLGAIRNWVRMQDQVASEGVDCLFFLADLHAISMPHVPADLTANTRAMTAALVACGIDPDRSTLFNQARAARTINDALKLPPVVTEEFAKHCQYCDARPICEAAARGDDKPLREASLRTVRFMNAPRRNADFPA